MNQGLPFVRGEYLIWPDGDGATGLPVKAQESRGDLRREDLFWDVLEGKTSVCCGCYMLKSRPFFEIYPDRRIPEYDVG